MDDPQLISCYHFFVAAKIVDVIQKAFLIKLKLTFS